MCMFKLYVLLICKKIFLKLSLTFRYCNIFKLNYRLFFIFHCKKNTMPNFFLIVYRQEWENEKKLNQRNLIILQNYLKSTQ